MTDRELLKYAAKAAGMTLGAWSERWLAFLFRDAAPGKTWWNPLTDDGDALRLAVKLAIDFKIRNEATWWDHQESEGVVYWSHEPHNGDPLAATRRAITRAAAETGKAMP